MPWRSAQASKNAVRGCFASAGKSSKKKKKCSRMAHEAKQWRMHNVRTPAKKSGKGGRR